MKSKVHPTYKTKYRVANWPAYNRALVRRGDVTVWVFLALQRRLGATGHPAACTSIDKKGSLVDFGVTLDANGPFSKNCPMIGDCFRDMNARRNRLPLSHPYEKKTLAQSRHLKVQERNQFVARLRTAYADVVSLMP